MTIQVNEIDMDAPMGGSPEETLEEKVDSLIMEVAALRATQEQFIALVKQYGDQLAPALASLSTSPIGKFLGM